MTDYGGDRPGNPTKGRGLRDLGRRLGAGVIEAAVAKRLEASGRCRVLEIGCGEGRVLMELRSRFPGAELHGVNRTPWWAMRGSESLPAVAAFFDVSPPAPRVPLPVIHFCDAAEMPLPAEHFDLVFSQATFHFVRRKDRAMEEIVRVLKPGGEAHVQMDSAGDDSAECCPRFVIEAEGRRIPTPDYLTRRCGDLARLEWRKCEGVNGGRITVLSALKTHPGQIRLGLALDEARSRPLDGNATPGWLNYGYYSAFAPEAELVAEAAE